MTTSFLIDIDQLRVGMYVQLDVGWLRHPFPVNNFRITAQREIDILKGLNLQRVRYVPARSDPALRSLQPGADDAVQEEPHEEPRQEPSQQAAGASGAAEGRLTPQTPAAVRRSVLMQQRRALARCEEHFAQATAAYQQIVDNVRSEPRQARALCETLVLGCTQQLHANGESVIRLLSEEVGVRSTAHPVNVMVLSLLLGQALGFGAAPLNDLGIAAFLHDLGKIALPHAVAQPYPHLAAGERALYERHVSESVALGQRMGLSPTVLAAMGQHHEMADGSGFPGRLLEGQMGASGQVIALVNHYERLCNPAHGAADALTPHEALSVIFAQFKTRFHSTTLGTFIRMMGVYPPGSLLQLTNDRYAIVVSVSPTQPLRPRVVVYEPQVPREEALVLDLSSVPDVGIRRSLRPVQLPRQAMQYLSPRERVRYFFERASTHRVPEQTLP